MIKVTVRYNDHLVDIHFPCSESTLRSALMEIHAADDNPPELFVTDVIFPEELDHLKDRFVNLDELNYLAKRMESFFGTEEEQFYEAMKQEGLSDLYAVEHKSQDCIFQSRLRSVCICLCNSGFLYQVMGGVLWQN